MNYGQDWIEAAAKYLEKCKPRSQAAIDLMTYIIVLCWLSFAMGFLLAHLLNITHILP